MPKGLLKKVEPRLLGGGLTIVKKLRQAGYQSYFAGGAVRDLLLGRPLSDIDIATAAPPAKVEELFPRTIPVGKRFGTVTVLIEEIPYEVTTFRREHQYSDGRHPDQVEFTGAREDALRRDFTINALFLDPLTESILDYVGGQEDLKAGLIRTVGKAQERFSEDKLRLLRAVRLACQLDFRLEEKTFQAVCALAPQLTQVSWERIRDELVKILTGPQPARGLILLQETGILKVILPEVEDMVGLPQPPEFHPEGDVFRHVCLMFEKADQPDVTLALAILLHDVGKPATFQVKERIRFDGHVQVGAGIAEQICRRLRLSKEQTEEILDLVRNHMKFMHVREMRESTLKRFLGKENFAKHLELHRLDCLGSHGDLSNYQFCLEKLEEFGREQIRPQPLLKGHDLIALGLKPGPLFGEILKAVEDRQLENRLKTREEALEWVRRHYLK